MKRGLAFVRMHWVAVILALCAVGVAVLWARSYDPPGPRYIEGPVLVKYTSLPGQLLLFYPGDGSCIYASVVRGWTRIGQVKINPPYGPAPPRDDEEAWMWLGSAQFPDPTMVLPGSNFVQERLLGLCITGSVPFASGQLQGVAVPCWLLVAIFMAWPVATAIKAVRSRRFRAEGLCTKCGYNLAGLTEHRCPECGTAFSGSLTDTIHP